MTDKAFEEKKQELVEHSWKGYQTGQGSADHTAKQVFEEVVGNLIDFVHAQGMEEAAEIVYPQSMRDETCGLDSFDVAYNGSREDAALSIRKANEEKSDE